jgi:hypothetical protein
MRRLFICLLFLLILSPGKSFALTANCESALKTLFAEEVSAAEAGDFLKLQGEITLHRLAWAFLKNQQSNNKVKVESIERSIIELLNEKYINSDPDFIRAREAFEAQPLSRSALADIAPYLKNALSASYDEKDQNFKLNQSDLKFLSALARHERSSAVDGKFDHRMLDARSPRGILNFVKLINSSYKISSNLTENDLNIEVKLRGLENVMANMQVKLGQFLNNIDVPPVCKEEDFCDPNPQMKDIFDQNEDLQKIFWESLSSKLESDDIIVQRLSYGDIWLKVKDAKRVKASPSQTSNQDISQNLPVRNPEIKTVDPVVAANAGLIIEDPIGIIVKDRPGRSGEAWSKFDKSFQLAMAKAIVSDETVFLYEEKLYRRKTGRQVSPEVSLDGLPPKRQAEARQTLGDADASLKLPLAAAIANGQKTFISQEKLYNSDGKQMNPGLVIAEVMTKKTGVKHEASRYQGMGSDYLAVRADALKNDRPYFKYGTKTMDTLTGRDLSSPFREVASTDAKLDKTRRRLYENLSDTELIRNFHREKPNPDCKYYGIIDKQQAMLKIYGNNGDEVYSSEVLIGAESSDKRTRWTQYSDLERTASNSTGAGIFTIRPQNFNDTFNKKNFNNNILSFKDESDKNTVFAIHQVPVGLSARYTRFGTDDPEDRRVSGGCANLKLEDFNALKKWLGPLCKVYILPEEEGNKFVLRDNQLKLVSTSQVSANQTNFYSYSLNDAHPAKINIKIANAAGNTQQAKEFVKALEDEKPKLMKMYRLSNDEYNDLAMLAYGVLGNESGFGKSNRLMIKENAQFAVITARILRDGSSLDHAKNTSRGLTQIKFLPGEPFNSNYPEVTKENLMNPRNAAVATMGYLADAARQMRQIAIKNQSDPAKLRITRENMMDFMGYLYQGSRSSLSTSDAAKQATPEFNAYYRNLQQHMSYIEISQLID